MAEPDPLSGGRMEYEDGGFMQYEDGGAMYYEPDATVRPSWVDRPTVTGVWTPREDLTDG